MNLPPRTGVVDRLMGSIGREHWRYPEEPVPSMGQVSMVAHALADHTVNNQMVRFSDDAETPAHAVGRWMHAFGDDLDNFGRGLSAAPLRAGDYEIGPIEDLPSLPESLGGVETISAPEKADHKQGFQVDVTFGDGHMIRFVALVDTFGVTSAHGPADAQELTSKEAAAVKEFGFELLRLITTQMRERITVLLDLTPSLLVFAEGKIHVS